MLSGLQGGLSSLMVDGEPKPKAATPVSATIVVPPISGAKPKKKPVEYDMGAEIMKYGKTPMAFDEDRPVNEIVKEAATKVKIDPSLLFASAWQEGMGAAALRPDDISRGYQKHEKELTDYPVDGFLNYGLDTFGSQYKKLIDKGYLPKDFDTRFKPYPTKNEAENVMTAAFRTNEDALMAKGAMLKDSMDTVSELAKKKGIELDPKALNYFTLASYNSKADNLPIMMDEYAKAKDKDAFIEQGLTSRKGVHKNIKPRIDNMKIAQELLK